MNSDGVVKFLLVDDKEENLLALDALLRRKGLELIWARSGHEALEQMLVHDFGLAILDVQMPEMDGYELAELMRGSQRTKHIPIIFLTAGGFDDRRRFRGYEAGAVDFLFKPIEPEIMRGKADVFFDLCCQRHELERQRDDLKETSAENVRLLAELRRLNESLEERVTERTKQLLDTNEQLQGFTYSIAHDFRQHIRNININAEMLLYEAGPEYDEWRPNVERIGQVARLMSRMSEDLLTYARARTMPLRQEEIDVTASAQDIAKSYQATFPKTHFQCAPGIRIKADRTLFRIVLENLLDNAFKYSQKAAEPMVEVGEEENGFFVRDNGVGIDMAYAEKLFKPFERLSVSEDFDGTGMGLANVKRIIDRHNGSIHVTSSGAGATFHVCLTPSVGGDSAS